MKEVFGAFLEMFNCHFSVFGAVLRSEYPIYGQKICVFLPKLAENMSKVAVFFPFFARLKEGISNRWVIKRVLMMLPVSVT